MMCDDCQHSLILLKLKLVFLYEIRHLQIINNILHQQKTIFMFQDYLRMFLLILENLPRNYISKTQSNLKDSTQCVYDLKYNNNCNLWNVSTDTRYSCFNFIKSTFKLITMGVSNLKGGGGLIQLILINFKLTYCFIFIILIY